VLADGVSIVFPRDYCHKKMATPTTISPSSHECAHAKVMPMYLLKPKVGKLLARSVGRLYARDKADHFSNLTPLEERELAAALNTDEYRFIIDLLALKTSEPDTRRQELLRRLLRVLASSEPVSQFMRYPTPKLIRLLVAGTCTFEHVGPALSMLSPLLFDLWPEFGNIKSFQDAMVAVADRADAIEASLEYDGHSSCCHVPPANAPEPDYRQAGAYYSASIKRLRPKYSKLEGKQAPKHEDDPETATADCRKYYESKRALTGGFMILWCRFAVCHRLISAYQCCRHRICVGFHIIYKGEGRNDVFSPVYTRWAKPPRSMIYDFACQLKGYNVVSISSSLLFRTDAL
jgi:hypothetical protein